MLQGCRLGLIWPIFCFTPRPQLSNVLRCGVMAKKPKDIAPRFGIGEWFGNPKSIRARAFRTIVKNRMQRGGIMAAGAGLVKTGEAGRGLKSRWYPETLAHRIEVLQGLRDRISFEQADAFDVVRRFADDPNAFFFVDPPYTAGGKKAGARLYTHNEIDHEGLFALMSRVRGSVVKYPRLKSGACRE